MSCTRMLSALAGLALLNAPALAGTGDDATGLEAVVVTATRNETSLAELPIPVVVIDRATIERNAGAGLPDLLRLAAGVEIAQSGGPGQLATVFIRGTESDHVLVLIDGVELSPGTIGTLQLQNIDPAVIERIEIVKGPRSALYGSEAVGGVINIITRRGADTLRAHVGSGSFGSHEAGAGTSLGWDDVRFGVDVTHRESDGFPPRSASDIDRGYANTSARLHLRASIGPADVTLRHYASEGETEYLDAFLAPQSQDFENTVSEAKFAWRAGAWRSQLSISGASDRLTQQGALNFSDTDRRVVDWQHDFQIDRHAFTAGLYFENEQVVAENFGRTAADTDVRAVYLQDHWRGENADVVVSTRATDHERFGNETSWNADAGWDLAPNWQLRLNAGRAFRAPNATFLFGPFGANPNLQPEVSTSGELALSWSGEHQSFTLAAFDTRITDMIDFDPVALVYENIARVRIRGIEFGHEWQAGDWRGHGSVTLQEPENRVTGEPLLRRATRSVTIGAQRAVGDADFGFDIVAQGERPDIDADTFLPVTDAGYLLLNLTMNWRMNVHWSLAARLENALDTDYQTAAGYNSADRGVFVTLRYTL